MEEILAEPLADSANSTIITVVYAFLAVIIPKLADIAVVLGSLLVTMSAIPCRRLSMSAKHAKHILSVSTNERMIFNGVMAEPASIPFLASVALQLDISMIMLAA